MLCMPILAKLVDLCFHWPDSVDLDCYMLCIRSVYLIIDRTEVKVDLI
jgi:hypothetical protein